MGVPLRVGIVCHHGYGGSAKIGLGVAIELARSGHTPTLFTKFPPYFRTTPPPGVSCRTLYPSTDRGGHPVEGFLTEWPQRDLEGLERLILEVIKQEGLDVLHVHYGLPFAFVAWRIKQTLGPAAPAMVLTLHGTDVTKVRPGSLEGFRYATALASFDALTTVSLSHAHLFTRIWHFPLPEVIPNFTRVKGAVPRSLDPGRARRLIHVSNFRQIKNLDGVVRIFAGISRKLDTELWLVGEGEEMAFVRGKLEQLGLLQQVRFLGLRPSVSEVFPEVDFLVMASRNESFCLVALEAMAFGLPVLAPKVGGIPEIVEDGATGLLYAPEDYEAAVERPLVALTDTGSYAGMSAAALKRAGQFDRPSVVSRYRTLYERFIKPAPPQKQV